MVFRRSPNIIYIGDRVSVGVVSDYGYRYDAKQGKEIEVVTLRSDDDTVTLPINEAASLATRR